MKKQSIRVDFNGVEYKSQNEMCKAFNVSPTLFLKRLERGWSLKEALTGKRPLFTYNGVDYHTKKEISEVFDVPLNTIAWKLKHGYTYEEIVEKKTYRITDHNGKRFKNTDEMCAAHGTTSAKYRAKRRSGLSIEDSLKP